MILNSSLVVHKARVVDSVGFLENGTIIVSVSRNEINVHNAGTFKLKATKENAHTDLAKETQYSLGGISSTAYSPVGSNFVSSGLGGTIKVWDVANPHHYEPSEWKEVQDLFPIYDSYRTLQLSEITYWKNTVTGDVRREHSTAATLNLKTENANAHDEWIVSVAFSPDGTKIVSACDNFKIRIWYSATLNLKAENAAEAHGDRIGSVAFSPDGTKIVSGGRDYTIKVWDADSLALVAQKWNIDSGGIENVVYNHDGTKIVSACDGGSIHVWEMRPLNESEWKQVTETGEETFWQNRVTGDKFDCKPSAGTLELKATTEVAYRDHINSLALGPDGKTIVSGLDDTTIKIWVANPRPYDASEWDQNKGVFPNTERPIIYRLNRVTGDARRYDSNAGTLELKVEKQNTHGLHTDVKIADVKFSPDGSKIVSCGESSCWPGRGQITVWNLLSWSRTNHHFFDNTFRKRVFLIILVLREIAAQLPPDAVDLIVLEAMNDDLLYEYTTDQYTRFQKWLWREVSHEELMGPGCPRLWSAASLKQLFAEQKERWLPPGTVTPMDGGIFKFFIQAFELNALDCTAIRVDEAQKRKVYELGQMLRLMGMRGLFNAEPEGIECKEKLRCIFRNVLNGAKHVHSGIQDFWHPIVDTTQRMTLRDAIKAAI